MHQLKCLPQPKNHNPNQHNLDNQTQVQAQPVVIQGMHQQNPLHIQPQPYLPSAHPFSHLPRCGLLTGHLQLTPNKIAQND